MSFPDHSKNILSDKVIFGSILAEAVLLLAVWLYDEYLGKLLTVIAVVIPLGVFVVSLFAEIIEKSNISKRYFWFILALILLPICIWFIFYISNMN
jgi:hypothetical protein